MGQIKYPLREAMKAQDIKQEEIIKIIRKSRQTITRYINQYRGARLAYLMSDDAF